MEAMGTCCKNCSAWHQHPSFQQRLPVRWMAPVRKPLVVRVCLLRLCFLRRFVVVPTLLAHYSRPFNEGSRGTFRKVQVEIEAPNGLKVRVDLCIATWAVVVAGIGLSTFEKLRAKVPELASRSESSSVAPMILFKDTI